MNSPFFSLLIPVYQNISFLKECIRSILSQDYKNFEIVICVQGDTKLETLGDDDRIRIIKLPNPSSYISRIALYKAANGKYAWFIDSDDVIIPGSLSFLKKAIDETDYKDFYQFGYYQNDFSHGKQPLNSFNPSLINVIEHDSYLHKFLCNEQFNPLWRKCIKIKNTNFYNEDIFMADDGLLTLAFIQSSNHFVLLNEKLYIYRYNSNSGARKRNPNHFNDLCIFLEKTLEFRKEEEEIKYLVYLFSSSFINYYAICKIYYRYFSSVDSVFLFVLNSKIKLRPTIYQKAFMACALNKKTKFILLHSIIKICKKIKILSEPSCYYQ